ncbi:MAG: ATP-binding protein [Candidatus Accumulibacter phosphatis]|nr:ATP-binding protein [Candidatus Accumulibacter phosphatis]
MDQIIDGDPVPTFVINAEHKVTHWNRACAKITGVPTDEIVGTTRQWSAFYARERPVMADLIVTGALEAEFDALYTGRFRRSALIDGAFEGEDYFPHFGECGRWLFFTAAPLRTRQGRVIGAIETLQDVSDRREAEEALRRHQQQLEELVGQRTTQLQQANEQLLQSEKLASIGQLAAGVAHEINNPIGYVHSNIGSLEGYIEDLFDMIGMYEKAESSSTFPDFALALRQKREAIDLEFLKEDIPMLMRESREGIDRVRKIVQDLKDFSHVDSSNEWQWANLHAGIESTLNVVRNEVKYKADVVQEFGDIPEIECLPSQLNQVFVNLLVNAAHAMGEQRGQITIRTGNGSDSVWLEFADTGSGIPEEIQARIFDPFFTTKPVGKGTGLGLSLSYGIIQRHNGTISVRSRTGEGTVFRIVLPIRHVEPEVAA